EHNLPAPRQHPERGVDEVEADPRRMGEQDVPTLAGRAGGSRSRRRATEGVAVGVAAGTAEGAASTDGQPRQATDPITKGSRAFLPVYGPRGTSSAANRGTRREDQLPDDAFRRATIASAHKEVQELMMGCVIP